MLLTGLMQVLLWKVPAVTPLQTFVSHSRLVEQGLLSQGMAAGKPSEGTEQVAAMPIASPHALAEDWQHRADELKRWQGWLEQEVTRLSKNW